MTLPADNRSFWDRMYSKDPDIFGSQGSEFARWSLPFLQRESPGGRIVELGCGTGRDMMYFAEHGFDVRGVDLSEVATRLANRRLAALRDSSLLQWAVQGDAAEYLTRLSANGVDVVYSNLFFNMETEKQRHCASSGRTAPITFVRPAVSSSLLSPLARLGGSFESSP